MVLLENIHIKTQTDIARRLLSQAQAMSDKMQYVKQRRVFFAGTVAVVHGFYASRFPFV